MANCSTKTLEIKWFSNSVSVLWFSYSFKRRASGTSNAPAANMASAIEICEMSSPRNMPVSS